MFPLHPINIVNYFMTYITWHVNQFERHALVSSLAECCESNHRCHLKPSSLNSSALLDRDKFSMTSSIGWKLHQAIHKFTHYQFLDLWKSGNNNAWTGRPKATCQQMTNSCKASTLQLWRSFDQRQASVNWVRWLDALSLPPLLQKPTLFNMSIKMLDFSNKTSYMSLYISLVYSNAFYAMFSLLSNVSCI